MRDGWHGTGCTGTGFMRDFGRKKVIGKCEGDVMENSEVKDVAQDPEQFTCRFIAALKRTFSAIRSSASRCIH